jgi:hypothetical protein
VLFEVISFSQMPSDPFDDPDNEVATGLTVNHRLTLGRFKPLSIPN